MAYSDDISTLGADHHWKFDGDSLDAIGSANGTDTTVTHSTDSKIAEDANYCVRVDAVGDRISIPTTADINSATQSRWAFGGWFVVTAIQEPPKSIAGRGDGTDSMRFILFLGNRIMVEADPGGTDAILQSFGDIFLANNRSYHLFARWSGNGYDNEFSFWIDGVEQTDAEPADRQPDIANFPATTVLEFADPAGTVSVGGTAVILNACVNGKYQHWAVFNDAAIPTDTEIREELFEKGALPDTTISTGTESAMQTALDVLANSTRSDAPLCIRVQAVTGGGDLTLTADDILFNELASIHVQYTGTDTLTWINGGTTTGSNASIFSTPNGGTVVVLKSVTLTVTAKDATAFTTIQGARVLLLADAGGVLPNDDTVTITRVSTTATVTHTAHGLLTGEEVQITGANQAEYNGVQTITVAGANSYTYTVSGTPTTPATGTIKATAVLFEGLTNASGIATGSFDHRELEGDQPVTGRARKASAAPYYKTAPIEGTMDAEGLTLTTLLVLDQ